MTNLQSYYSSDLIEAGADEAGRGCLAGPVVAAAVILPKDFFHPLLRDSKKLNAAQRELLEEIIHKEAIAYAIGVVDHHMIDEINILKASFRAMNIAIGQLKPVPELLLIDGNRFHPQYNIPFKCIVKGDDKFSSIAAASVLAKTHRDRMMAGFDKDYPIYNWQQNKGYPTTEHRKAIVEHGICPLHRKSFRLFDNEKQLEIEF